jgi:prepilin-type N-terminal cleavage/methylation domain-containing protein
MKSKINQSGFTLVEMAIVLVIIGLLLGGILKGQELINSAKVKNLANDFRVVPTYIYAYQDKFRSLPGDDRNAVAHVGSGAGQAGVTTAGNGLINGDWNSTTVTDESVLFWQHIRLANLASGSTNTGDPTFFPQNAEGGRIGLQSGVSSPITGLQGSYIFCSDGILGKFAKQLDTTLDDGDTAKGSVQVKGGTSTTAVPTTGTGGINDADKYSVCMGF